MTGIEEGLPPARAGAPHGHLAVEPRLGPQPLHRAFGVADHLRIRNAAFGAHLGGDVLGFAFAGTVIEIVADGGIAVMREPAGRLAIEFIPAGRVVNQHDAGIRTRPQRPRDIGRDRLALVAVHRNRLSNHAFVGHPRSPLGV